MRRWAVSPALAMAIDAARDVAWRPTANCGKRRAVAYAERKEAHQRLVDALEALTGLSANASPQLRFLLAAMRRVAACSFANRMGLPYYERKQAVAELRGCLIVYDRETDGPASRSRRDSVGVGLGTPSRRRAAIEASRPMPAPPSRPVAAALQPSSESVPGISAL